MSNNKYVQETLALPSEMPLFNYNINFDGLRKLLEDVNVKTNTNEEDIRKLQQLVSTKLPTTTLQQTEKKLNASYLFGQRSQNYVDQQEEKIFTAHRTKVQDLPDLDQFCYKMNRMAEIMEVLMGRTDDHEQRLGADSKRYEKLVDDSFRRLEEKLNSHIDSFTKTINGYFTQTNQKVADQQSSLNTHKLTSDSKWKDFTNDMNKKVSDNVLKAALEGTENKIKKQLESVLKNDQMQRLATLNDLKNAIADSEKDQDLKNKILNNKMQQFTEKVNKSLLITNFEIEKHKIFEKMSEIKSRTDDLWKKNNEFMQFRKSYLTNNQKVKQEIVGINDEIKKMNQNEGTFKKMEGMSNILNSLNPHLICELGEEVKLHEKQIGKLEKHVIQLEQQLSSYRQDKPKPEVNHGQNSDLIQKIIKEFMSNMNFQDRVKRSEKEILDLKKRNDIFSELEKKIYNLSKEIDIPAIMKELHRKCDEENTRRDTKILDGKIEQLFEFYKQLRKEVDQKKKTAKNDPFQNASLTTKKLVSANCLSCTPSVPSTRRNYSGRRLQVSVDYGLQSHKNTIYSRFGH